MIRREPEMKRALLVCYLLVAALQTPLTFAMQDISIPKVKWKFKTQGMVRGTAIVSDNTVFFANTGGVVYAVNKNTGTLLWKYQTQAAVVSSPIVKDGVLYVANRSEQLLAINANDGQLRWTFDMGETLKDEHSGWKYFMASPTILNDKVLIGSGDGHLYAVNRGSGQLGWSFKTKGRVRSTALVHRQAIYQPSNDGYVYVLDFNGKLQWKFETLGATYNPNDFNFDRSSIIAQPLISKDRLVIASRDGNVYGIDLKTRTKVWIFAYGNTWAMSTTGSDGVVYVGWSTNDIFSALDLETGVEKWQFKTGSHNFPTALLSDSSAYIASSDGSIYRLDKRSGQTVWQYQLGDEIYSSPIYDKQSNSLFVGADDGYLYAIDNARRAHKAVYHPYDNNSNKFKNPKSSADIAPYLSQKGFLHITTEKELYHFIEQRIQDKNPSVIVFSHLVIPHSVLGINPDKGLMRQYLQEGGKVLWPGDIPNFYERNENGSKVRSKTPATALLDVEFGLPETGSYFSQTTQAGQNLGLPNWLKSYGVSVSGKGIIPLATNEFGQTSFWMKKFHPRAGAGYISGRTWGANTRISARDLQLLHDLAIYGLE